MKSQRIVLVLAGVLMLGGLSVSGQQSGSSHWIGIWSTADTWRRPRPQPCPQRAPPLVPSPTPTATPPRGGTRGPACGWARCASASRAVQRSDAAAGRAHDFWRRAATRRVQQCVRHRADHGRGSGHRGSRQGLGDRRRIGETAHVRRTGDDDDSGRRDDDQRRGQSCRRRR